MGGLIGLTARSMAASLGEESKYSPYDYIAFIWMDHGHIYDWI